MTDIPPDVRHRATTVVCTAMRNRQPGSLDLYNAVVDAVAEALTAGPNPAGDVWFSSQHVRDLAAEYVAQRDALKARVDLLTTALTGVVHYINSCPTIPMSTQLRTVLSDAVAVLSAGEGKPDA